MPPILSHCLEIPIIPLQHMEPHVTISLTAQKAAQCPTQGGDAEIYKLILHYDLIFKLKWALLQIKKNIFKQNNKGFWLFKKLFMEPLLLHHVKLPAEADSLTQ